MIILVLNIGLKNARCIAFSDEGELVAQYSKPVHTFVSDDKVEQDPREWISLTTEVIGSVLTLLGEKKSQIEYLTVTTSASCLVNVDSSCEPIHKSILVSDTRSTLESELISNWSEFNELSKEGAKSSPDLMAPKILWIKKNKPDWFARSSKFLNIGDFINAKLTGRYITDPNNAQKFFYSTNRKKYPTELLEKIGISSENLPNVGEIGEVIGSIRSEFKEKLGFKKDCKVVLSTYDALASVVGSGGFNNGDAVDISGTVTSFRVTTDQKVIDHKKQIYTNPHFSPGMWLVGGSNNLGGGIIEWLKNLYYGDYDNPYSTMEIEAQSANHCPGGLIFLPHLLGERAPIWDPGCRGVFFGINRAHDRKDFTRAVFEGIAYSVNHISLAVSRLGIDINNVTVAGGLSQIGLVNQIKADVLGVPIRKYDSYETTSIGAALIALIGLNKYKDYEDGFHNFCSLEKVYEPRQSLHQVYSEFFDLYLKVYHSLSDCYIERLKVLEKNYSNGVKELRLTDNL